MRHRQICYARILYSHEDSNNNNENVHQSAFVFLVSGRSSFLYTFLDAWIVCSLSTNHKNIINCRLFISTLNHNLWRPLWPVWRGLHTHTNYEHNRHETLQRQCVQITHDAASRRQQQRRAASNSLLAHINAVAYSFTVSYNSSSTPEHP